MGNEETFATKNDLKTNLKHYLEDFCLEKEEEHLHSKPKHKPDEKYSNKRLHIEHTMASNYPRKVLEQKGTGPLQNILRLGAKQPKMGPTLKTKGP